MYVSWKSVFSFQFSFQMPSLAQVKSPTPSKREKKIKKKKGKSALAKSQLRTGLKIWNKVKQKIKEGRTFDLGPQIRFHFMISIHSFKRHAFPFQKKKKKNNKKQVLHNRATSSFWKKNIDSPPGFFCFCLFHLSDFYSYVTKYMYLKSSWILMKSLWILMSW